MSVWDGILVMEMWVLVNIFMRFLCDFRTVNYSQNIIESVALEFIETFMKFIMHLRNSMKFHGIHFFHVN